MRTTKSYDKGYKEQAVKLIKEVGVKRASGELGVPQGTLYGWVKAAEHGELDIGERTPGNAMSLAEELRQLRAQNKSQAKEIKRLNELNEFLAEASAFFAASRQKSAKTKE
jgi:transposase